MQAPEWKGPKFQTLVNASNVARKFETNRRRLDVDFKHHAETAALPPAAADVLLDAAAAEGLSTRQLRAEVSKVRNATAIGAVAASSETCSSADLAALVSSGQRFGCIYADPPWLYDNQGTRGATGNCLGVAGG